MRNKWVSLTSKMLLSIGILSLLVISSPAAAQDGEAIFKGNCAACHKIDKKMTGPALRGARENWVARTGGTEALIAWVKNSQAYIKETNDKYAKDLLAEYNGTIMTPMPLSDEEIIAVFDYVDNYQEPVAAGDAAVATDGAQAEKESNPLLWLIVVTVVLFVVFSVIRGVSRNLENLNRIRDGLEPVEPQWIIGSILDYFRTNRAATTIVVVLVIAYLSVLGWDWLNGVGVSTNYQPKQPIWFSHKVHAGQNGINCVYCHNSAEKGKAAGIPSVNICMNCHMGVQEGKQTGTAEIAKIYAAIGWDPDKGRYIEGYEQKPIEWVRIHNLQDFVYFNHSQHVVVGKQECQTCHGPVETMDEMYQYSELTMGWCINCHRETEVSMDGNGYYDRIHADLVEKYKKEGLEVFNVEHIGGLECAKCHY